MTIAIQGLLAGAAHVLSGPDHLAGVAPLAADRPAATGAAWPARIGATWGLGHGLGVAILGVLGQTLLSAADVLGRNPGSIQLRYLQTLADIANERSSIVAFPIPVDLLSRLSGNGSQDKPPQ